MSILAGSKPAIRRHLTTEAGLEVELLLKRYALGRCRYFVSDS